MLPRELFELFIQEPSDVCIREDTHKKKFLLVVGPIHKKKKLPEPHETQKNNTK